MLRTVLATFLKLGMLVMLVMLDKLFMLDPALPRFYI